MSNTVQVFSISRDSPIATCGQSRWSTVDTVQLTKDTIVDAALVILDNYGLGDLTMRRLARALDSAPGALYWHFPSKQALLGAVADRILAPLANFRPESTWPEDVNNFTTALYQALLAHRDGAEVVSAALATTTASIRPEQVLCDAMLSPRESPAAALPEHIARGGDVLDMAAVLVFFVLGTTVELQTAAMLHNQAPDNPSDSSSAKSGSARDSATKSAAARGAGEKPALTHLHLPEELALRGRQRIALGTELFLAGIKARG